MHPEREPTPNLEGYFTQLAAGQQIFVTHAEHQALLQDQRYLANQETYVPLITVIGGLKANSSDTGSLHDGIDYSGVAQTETDPDSAQ